MHRHEGQYYVILNEIYVEILFRVCVDEFKHCHQEQFVIFVQAHFSHFKHTATAKHYRFS